jgi:hypothetical protein
LQAEAENCEMLQAFAAANLAAAVGEGLDRSVVSFAFHWSVQGIRFKKQPLQARFSSQSNLSRILQSCLLE